MRYTIFEFRRGGVKIEHYIHGRQHYNEVLTKLRGQHFKIEKVGFRKAIAWV